ncbi:cell envelope biogenesis protein OmpA [Polaribacter sp. SA4-10]|uniref:OmpA family protein n=1 Tax=Polaribacter sp. SA4-10 TaxID=754397 RepID=UPI000B3CAB72|nr:OmpA family protein [Polaribacter sp. SA4-10]ARV07314.1 cell envelope biogenesis protein OmpA [Polaribacter sp. SA4-10]
MKRFKLVVMALFTLVTVSSANAQDENKPWAIGFGIHGIDFYSNSDLGGMFKELIGPGDVSYIPTISKVSADRYLNKGFSLQLAGYLNKTRLSDLLYYSIDATVKYDLNNLVGQTGWFDPYVYAGSGYTSIDSSGEAMLNVGAGFNTWLSKDIGLNFQSGIKNGFSDVIDNHFQTSMSLVIRFGGKDTDGDGVYDKKDACLEVPGLKEFNGCPDADGDGIKDSDDACPNVAGLAAMNGCPDADGDGVADKDDMCPNSKGTKANKGCPDTDGDGVVDKNDKCSTEAGPIANGGCPWLDTDGDSILDKDDKCPLVSGIASEGGCPEVISNEAQMGIDTFAEAILFNTGRSSFKLGVTEFLDSMLAIINEYPTAEFEIRGFTDSVGSDKGNLKLSDKRANAVKDYLVKNGIAAARLTAIGFGEESPIDSNKTRAGRAKNRRVEVKVIN